MEITASMVKELREITGAGMMDCKAALQETKGNMEEAIKYLREKGIAKSVKREGKIAAEGLANVLVKDNFAVILEVNSETDFVSKNEEFIEMVNTIGETILENKVKTMEEALELKVDKDTLNDYVVEKTAKIGEKIAFRRFTLLEKQDDEVFGTYIHMGGNIAVLIKVKGSDEEIAKDVAMHYAAMKPEYLFKEDVSEEVLNEEKELLKKQAMDEGKPADIAEKMVAGKINRFYKDNCLVEQAFVKDDSVTVGTYLKNNNSILLEGIRYEVGEGIEKKEENFLEEVKAQMGE